jgi:hypothetical protein
MNVLRRIRGVLGTAMLWSIAWAPLGIAWSTTVWITAGRTAQGDWAPFPPVLGPMIMCAFWGFIGGALFATALALVGRREASVASLRVRRVGLLGGIVGAVLPLVYSGVGVALGIATYVPSMLLIGLCGAVGAGVASSALRIAQRNDPQLAKAALLPRNRLTDT